jgi:type II secretory pathway pseudopilin PulG
LAAIAVPKFADMVTKSKEASAKGSLGAVRSAVSIYYGDMEGLYPSNLFDGLATGNRYMPAVNGSPSLGSIAIPKHSNFTSNPGHTFTSVQTGDVALNTFADAKAFFYSSTDGAVYIGCSHVDTKGSLWSGY